MVIDVQVYQTGNKQQNTIRHHLLVSVTPRVCTYSQPRRTSLLQIQ